MQILELRCHLHALENKEHKQEKQNKTKQNKMQHLNNKKKIN